MKPGNQKRPARVLWARLVDAKAEGEPRTERFPVLTPAEAILRDERLESEPRFSRSFSSGRGLFSWPDTL